MIPYPQYQDSGVEWIGQIPVDWDVIRLKWAIKDKLKYGANESAELTDTSLPRYIRITDFDENGSLREQTFKSLVWEIAENYLLEEGDILFARSGATVGKTFQFKNYNGTACFAGYLIKASPNQSMLNSDFLYHYTRSSAYENWKNSIFIQATIQNIGADKYQNLHVVLPPLEEQTAIATYLDRKTAQIDTLIAKKKRLVELLREERTAIISHAVTKGLDATVPLKDSGVEWIGEIPVHWEVMRLKSLVVEKLKYGANATTDLTDSALPRYIRITDFGEDGNLRDDTFRSMAWKIANEYLLEEGDILFARSGATVGKTFLFKNYDGVACFAGYLIKAKPNRSYMISDFLYYFTKSNAYENWKDSVFIQATIQNIGADKYQNLQLTVPPLEEQTAIATYLDKKTAQIDALIAKTRKQIKLLQEYRTALISSVVTGKVDVREEVIQ